MEACAWLEAYLPEQRCFYRVKLLDVQSDQCFVRFDALQPPETPESDTEWVRWEHLRDAAPPLNEPYWPREVRAWAHAAQRGSTRACTTMRVPHSPHV